MSWRPKDWKNLQTKLIKKAYNDYSEGIVKEGAVHGADGMISEATADVIVEELMKLGVHGNRFDGLLPYRAQTPDKGWAVFIPDEVIQ